METLPGKALDEESLSRLIRGRGKKIRTYFDNDQWRTFVKAYHGSELGRALGQQGILPEELSPVVAGFVLDSYTETIRQKLNSQLRQGKVQVKKSTIRRGYELMEKIDGESSLDHQLFEVARRKDLIVGSLDQNTNDLVDIFEQLYELSLSEKIALVQEVDQDPKKYFEILMNSLEVYAGIAERYRQGLPYDGKVFEDLPLELNQRLLSFRNEQWVELVLANQYAYKKVFLAAGVAHMYGVDSLLERLRAKGYSITRRVKPSVEDVQLN